MERIDIRAKDLNMDREIRINVETTGGAKTKSREEVGENFKK